METTLFGTFTAQLQKLRAWLRRHKEHRVVMESTGVYWMTVWNVLERCAGWKFDLLLINPHQAKALPGCKTDRIDCKRLAELGRHDLKLSSDGAIRVGIAHGQTRPERLAQCAQDRLKGKQDLLEEALDGCWMRSFHSRAPAASGRITATRNIR